jgi:hypothetical protein
MTHNECDYTFRLSYWCKIALDIQNACNLSGVVRMFAEMVQEMRASGMDTKECNEHPLTRLFVSKLYHLSFLNLEAYIRAVHFALNNKERENEYAS